MDAPQPTPSAGASTPAPGGAAPRPAAAPAGPTTITSAAQEPAPANSAAPPGAAKPKANARRIFASLRVGITEYDGVRVSDSLPARIEGIGFETMRASGIVTSVNGEYTVEVVVAPLGDESAGYVSTLVVYRGDDEVAGSRRRVKCELCLEDELLTQIREELSAQIDVIHADRAPPVPEPEPEPDLPVQIAPPPVVAAPPPVVEVEPPRRLGKLGGIGLVTAFLGAGAAGGGAALLATADGRARDLKGLSITMIGVGSAALITGVGMLIMDREYRPPRSAVAPSLHLGGAGVVWSGRF
ncbi:MAG: hypothetical protein R3A79_07240 [Nannocystaceae bacterium]